MTRKRLILFTGIIVAVVIMGIYGTYALDIIVSEGTSEDYDMSLTFDIYTNTQKQVTIPAGKTKVFDIDINNPQIDTIKYGVAYSMVSPTTLPDGVIVAQSSLSPNPAVGLLNSNTTNAVSIIVVNESETNLTIQLSVINGYKNGGNLVVSTGKTLITDTYYVGPPVLTVGNIKVDGVSATAFPIGSYTVNTNCTTATSSFDYENWHLIVSNLSTSGTSSCSPEFTSTTKTYLNNKVISLAGTTQGTGQVVNENGYRYEGKNPNNYIKFNNEMWRIIGVFDANSHGQTGLNLTKIIRNESIGGYVWDKNENAVWPTSSLYNLLNTYYYNATNGQNSGHCYQNTVSGDYITGHCDYTNTGIQSYYRPMVKNVTWYLGGYSNSEATPSEFFAYERSTSDDAYRNPSYKTTNGYLGLMYPSDYGYSALSSSCDRTNTIYDYISNECAENSWILRNSGSWTITHSSTRTYYAYVVDDNGFLDYDSYYTNDTGDVRPTLYLDSSVYIVNGTGTESDPYIIAMD